MKTFDSLQFIWRTGCLALTLAWAPTSARAYVYATDIKVNGSLTTISNSANSPVSITYRLNQPATSGVTVNILKGTTEVAAIAGGNGHGPQLRILDPRQCRNIFDQHYSRGRGFSSLDTNQY